MYRCHLKVFITFLIVIFFMSCSNPVSTPPVSTPAPIVTAIVTAIGTCTAVSYTNGVFSLTFTITNTGNVPIQIILGSTFDLKGSSDLLITTSYYTYSSTLVTGLFIQINKSYTFTISGVSSYIPYYYDATVYFSDGNGHTNYVYWSNKSFN